MTAKFSSAKTMTAGVYVHVPFCAEKCPYCDFYSTTDLSLIPAYVEAVVCEIRMASSLSWPVDAIYFGGGTPSLLAPAHVRSILSALLERFNVLTDCEITLEANPGTVSPVRFEQYRSAGINRITLGVQSFSDKNLRFLGRIHSSEDARQAVLMARQAGFDNLGLDLIYGLPEQGIARWIRDLEKAVDFKPEHLSCYLLTYESGTRLDIQRKQGRWVPLEEARALSLFETTRTFLSVHGYAGYEISNFARVDVQNRRTPNTNRSRHNQKYWSGEPYLGFGPAAHSYESPCRSWNIKSVRSYIDLIHQGKPVVEEQEVLTPQQQMIEAVYLGLRTADGIDIKRFDTRFNVSFYQVFSEITDGLKAQQQIEASEFCCRLTPQGMLISDAIAGWFAGCV